MRLLAYALSTVRRGRTGAFASVLPRATSDTGHCDDGLIEAMGFGSQDAANSLYVKYADRLFRFIYRRIGFRAEDAEELVIDTFLSAAKMARTYDGKASAFSWLCGIANVRIIDFHRRANALKRGGGFVHLSLSELPYEELAANLDDSILDLRALDALMLRLRPEELEILTLRVVEELSTRETAAIVKKSERAVESTLFRAKSKLRDLLLETAAEVGA